MTKNVLLPPLITAAIVLATFAVGVPAAQAYHPGCDYGGYGYYDDYYYGSYRRPSYRSDRYDGRYRSRRSRYSRRYDYYDPYYARAYRGSYSCSYCY